MGRKAIPVDAKQLQTVIDTVEGLTGFPSRSELWFAVAATEWAKSLKLSPQVAAMKAKKLGITFKSQAGQRGRVKGQGFPSVTRPGRKPRVFSPERFATLMATVPQEMRVRLEKTVRKAASGNLRAQIAMHCWDCSAYQSAEIRACQMVECGTYESRPFREAKNNGKIPLTLA